MGAKYDSRLGAGQGAIDEMLSLIALYQDGFSAHDVYEVALATGVFGGRSAKRLKNFVTDAFAPRFLSDGERPAKLIQMVSQVFSRDEISQLMFVFACRASDILRDFTIDVYWRAYASGRETIANSSVQDFVRSGIDGGKTGGVVWSEKTIKNVAGYLTGTLADFGFLQSGRRVERSICKCSLRVRVALVLAYVLHLEGKGDNAVVAHPDWSLFGMERQDVVELLRSNSIQGGLIVQVAGEAVSISWRYKSLEELVNGIA